MDILIFKTNINYYHELKKIAGIMCDRRIIDWNVDRHDKDNVLRIESKGIKPAEVINLVCEAGFKCEELPD